MKKTKKMGFIKYWLKNGVSNIRSEKLTSSFTHPTRASRASTIKWRFIQINLQFIFLSPNFLSYCFSYNNQKAYSRFEIEGIARFIVEYCAVGRIHSLLQWSAASSLLTTYIDKIYKLLYIHYVSN